MGMIVECWLYQSKTSKILILHYQIDGNFSSKVHFMTFLITAQKHFARFAHNGHQAPPTLQIVSTPMQESTLSIAAFQKEAILFYTCKRPLLGALASEAARLLTSFSS